MSISKKYVPEKWNEIVFPNAFATSTVSGYANRKISSPLLIRGRPGNGKTKTIELIAKERGDDGSSSILLDCTIEMTSAQFKKKITDASMLAAIGLNGERFIQLNEIDFLSKRNQKTLCSIIDNAPSSSIFLATTNDVSGVEKSLRSRFTELDFDHKTSAEMEKFARKIALAEALPLSDDDVEALCISVDGCFRQLLMELERYAHVKRSKNSAQQKSKPKKTA